MSATQLEELLSIVGPLLVKKHVIQEPIQPKERLVITLRYVASGDLMTSMSYQYLIGVTTVSNIIRETCKAIWNRLCPLVLPPALSERDWLDIASDFEELTNFIHCIGAIDGKHVTIQCPNNAGSTYYNYKNAHSVVLMAICDARYIFRFVDIGAYGRRSDGGIYGGSVMGKNFNANRMNVPKPAAVAGGRILPYCLVGDEAFPLKPYLLRPYPGKNGLSQEQDIFNYRLTRARRMIESTFGILASQWRIYRKPIIAFPQNAKLMVQATREIADSHTSRRKQAKRKRKIKKTESRNGGEKKTESSTKAAFLTEDHQISDKGWILDSGASVHMTPNKKFFTTFKVFDGSEIVVADNSKLRAERKGSVTIQGAISRSVKTLATIPTPVASVNAHPICA
ncbi:PREDICTED: putative nuclease HARBI1 [Wasmannia auropunctata]|uniref:putative nuclease HARBI1 n=1 Tax=Wasmannia auropunctata TaxID=64793 RepID=UPI0005EF2C37|nr:PREDICTED: putative nuclease HARBI1 [Wasmannia auropunctata]